ncbi:MAG: TrkA family potassium uptake protein [Planctomycetota bacterium]
MQKEIDRLENHVVICGFGRMGRTLAEALAKRGRALIVIDHEEARVEAARGYGCLALHGNATEEKILRAPGVQRASTLTTVLSDDVANVFITISARAMNPNLEILARAERTSTVQKLQQVGANEVILPANIGADRLANLILRPSAESLLSEAKLPEGLNLDLASLGLTLDEVEVKQDSCIIGETLAQLKACGEHRFLIVAVRNSEGDVTLHPSETQVLASGDCVILLAHIDDLNAMREKYQLQCQSELDAAV